MLLEEYTGRAISQLTVSGWDDIGYNFLVGGDGRVYVGRGWTRLGAHNRGYNSQSIGIAFLGTFNTETPSERMASAAHSLIQSGVQQVSFRF